MKNQHLQEEVILFFNTVGLEFTDKNIEAVEKLSQYFVKKVKEGIIETIAELE